MAPFEPTALNLTFLAGAILLGSLVKGMAGIGLPTVAIPLLTLRFPVAFAVAVMAVPILLSNIVQIAQEGRENLHLRRFLPLTVLLMIGIFAGGWLRSGLPVDIVSHAMGLAVIAMVIIPWLFKPQPVPLHLQARLNPLIGLSAGVLGGVSTLIGPILVPYMLGIGLTPAAFASTISAIYCFAFLALAAVFSGPVLNAGMVALLSLAALVPMLIGLSAGRALRVRLPDTYSRGAAGLVMIGTGVSLLLS